MLNQMLNYWFSKCIVWLKYLLSVWCFHLHRYTIFSSNLLFSNKISLYLSSDWNFQPSVLFKMPTHPVQSELQWKLCFLGLSEPLKVIWVEMNSGSRSISTPPTFNPEFCIAAFGDKYRCITSIVKLLYLFLDITFTANRYQTFAKSIKSLSINIWVTSKPASEQDLLILPNFSNSSTCQKFK